MKCYFRADRKAFRLGASGENMFVSPVNGSVFALKSTPLFRSNLAYGDLVICKPIEGPGLKFIRLHRKGLFSTVRVVSKTMEFDSSVFKSEMEWAQKFGCGVTFRIDWGLAGVSVPPEVDLSEVLGRLEGLLSAEFVVSAEANRHS